LLNIEIDRLGGSAGGFTRQLNDIDSAFSTVLRDANITLKQRIDLERQLAQETLDFLQRAKSEIESAGLEIFGQSAEQNRDLDVGISALTVVAERLGGSFDNFLNLGEDQFRQISQELLSLPTELRQQILSALETLPSTVEVGGFGVEELRTALAQVGAGISPEAGLPSLEEILAKQEEELKNLQDLAQRDAELQISQVLTASDALKVAEAQLEAAEIAEERARENAIIVRDEVAREIAVLNEAARQREALTERVLSATKESELNQIEAEARQFERQTLAFRDIGESIRSQIEALARAQLSVINTGVPGGARGMIPNFAGGLSVAEAAGLLRAGAREKRAMPAGAGLAVANTSEAIIPMRNRGFIPNFQEGSQIAAGIAAVRGVNETEVAAISRAIIAAIGDVADMPESETQRIIADRLDRVVGELQDISVSNALISSNTSAQSDQGTVAPTANVGEEVNINVTTNQNNTVRVTNLENLESELTNAMRREFEQQFGAASASITEAIESIFRVLRERGIISSFGQSQ
jgi:hypothetical protein